MGKILEYSNLGAPPADNDLLFMGDYSADAANPTTMRLTIGDLNKKRNVDAADGDGLKLRDDGGNYGVYIDDGGKVGVGTAINPGTTDPTYDLDVQTAGVTTFRIRSGDSHDSLIRFDQTSTNQAVMGYDHSLTLFKINNHSSFGAQNHLVINTDGNVGLGVTAPDAALSLTGDIKAIEGSFGVIIDSSNAEVKGCNGAGVNDRLHLNADAGGDIWFMYDSGVPAGKIESSNKHWGIGPITTTVPDAKLHVLEATSATLPALKLQNSVASSRAIIELSANSSEVKRYIMSDTTGYVGIRDTNAALGSGSVNFSAGKLNVNATTFGRRLRVDGSTAAADIFVGSFNSSNTTGTKIELRNSSTVAAATPTNLIWFGNMSGTAGAEKVNWMAGAFRNTSVDFFGIHYDSSDFSADNVAFNTTLSNNKFYIDTDGGTHAHGYFNVNTDVTSPFHAAGDYCRGRFLQTFSIGIKADKTGPIFPALSTVLPGVSALYEGYINTSARTPDAQYMSRAPHNGKLVRVDVPIYFSNSQVGPGTTITPTLYFYSGSSLPSADGDSGIGSTNSAYKQFGILSEDTSYTVGYDTSTFTDTASVLEFSAGDYLAICFDTDATTGYFYANLALTFEFEID